MDNKLIYLLPLAAAICLVYNASRYELPNVILKRALSFFVKTMIFMVGVFLILYVLSFGL
ncbi:hypothetical protein [Stratiformator vulcanicus]|uniref:Uncharacterized protein n=1 Tax=Stratiformator vulcanicus TaxID=2527980 RepID=A0A517R4I5_9PLAN|nr:hypothetical protein [Stratiformator vulcanicus]QDT38787.1 hypothetical protein Pan189_31860 [Stratiformator vulcanicus]